MFDVIRAKGEARRARGMTESQLLMLQYRRQLAEAGMDTEKAERALEVEQALRRLGVDVQRALLLHQIEMEKLFLERDRLRHERLKLSSPSAAVIEVRPSPALPPPRPALPPPMEVDVTERQIESLAIRAANRFSTLPTRQAQAAWGAWRQELQRRFHPMLLPRLKPGRENSQT